VPATLPDQSENGRRETSHERLDRNLEELTGELRVIVTGVASELFGVLPGVLTVLGAAVPFALLWFVLPLRRRHMLESSGEPY